MQGLVGPLVAQTPPMLLENVAKNALASLLSVTVGMTVLGAPDRANATGLGAPTLHAASTLRTAAIAAPASVLGLKGPNAKANEELTTALRSAFATRGMTGGEELSLEEVMLTMGCEAKDNASCMTEAGKALNVDRLIYGELITSGGGYTLDIVVLDTGQGLVEAQASVPLESADLVGENIDRTAADVVNSLYPGDDDESTAPPPVLVEDDPGEDVVIEDDPEPRDSNYEWGKYSPRPVWKKAGLGVGVGLLGVGIVGAIVSSVVINSSESDVQTLVASSPNDENPANDIPTSAPDYCDAAEAPPQMGGGDVTNSSVAEACRRGRNARTVNHASFGVLGVGAAVTIAFTVLYFVHKKDPTGDQVRRARRFRLTGGANRSGFVLGGTGRF